MNLNERKVTAVAAYSLDKAKGEEYCLKLMTLMHLAERGVIRQSSCSITSDRFVSMDHSPVLSQAEIEVLA